MAASKSERARGDGGQGDIDGAQRVHHADEDGGEQRGFEQRQGDVPKNLEAAGAVDLSLLERLERQFSRERLRELRTSAERLAGELRASPPAAKAKRRSPRRATGRPVGPTV